MPTSPVHNGGPRRAVDGQTPQQIVVLGFEEGVVELVGSSKDGSLFGLG
jgi:hypothetical protein